MEREWQRRTRVDLVSATDPGESPPRSGLSFPTRRRKQTVSIAGLPPSVRSFRELGRTPSSVRLPFLGLGAARSPAETRRSSACVGARGWPEGPTRGRGSHERAAIRRSTLRLLGRATLGSSWVLPGLAHARLPPFCRPRGATEADER